jgi:diguanylate cyclase (GGDEF)-like protein
MIDLDHFKSVNDTLGHDGGDKVLVQAAKVMRKEVRASDVVCRLGGEEFLVISTDTDACAAMTTADRIRSAIEQQQPDLPLVNPVTTSVGVASCVPSPAGWQELMKAADKALYRAKQLGRNRVELAKSET